MSEVLKSEKAAALKGYGPIRVRTEVLDLPGFDYQDEWHRPGEPRIIGTLSNVLDYTVEGEGEQAKITIPLEGDETLELTNDQILGIRVDHPLGSSLPVDGTCVSAIKFQGNNPSILANRWKSLEFGYMERVRAGLHPEMPGVGVYDLFEAGYDSVKHEVPPLSYAIQKCQYPQTILVTPLDPQNAVVTSRIGYDEGRVLRVLRPDASYLKDMEKIDIDMFDVPLSQGRSLGQLLARHVNRVEFKGGDVNQAITQLQADIVFAYLMEAAAPGRP